MLEIHSEDNAHGPEGTEVPKQKPEANLVRTLKQKLKQIATGMTYAPQMWSGQIGVGGVVA